MAITSNDFTFREESFDPSSSSVMRGCINVAGCAAVTATSFFLAPGFATSLQRGYASDEAFNVDLTIREELAEATPAVLPADLIATAKKGLGLNVTELAGILKVSRPTLYSWKSGKTPVKQEALLRLQVLASIARYWAEKTSEQEKNFLIDYKGPEANALSVREGLADAGQGLADLKDLITARTEQYREASEESRAMIGEKLPVPRSRPSSKDRVANEAWAKNAKALHTGRRPS